MSTLNCPEEVYLAEKMIELHPWAGKVRFARSGGEANAIAIRIARAASGRDKVAICGYHGWHDWYLSANLNIQWIGIKQLKNIEGNVDFLLKDFKSNTEIPNSAFLRALKIFNLNAIIENINNDTNIAVSYTHLTLPTKA